jgi:hypothetical protein
VEFLNDAYGGSAATDRNLHVDGATYNGQAVAGAAASLMSAGAKGFSFTEAAPVTSGPVVLTAGTGTDALVLKISQDAYQGARSTRCRWTACRWAAPSPPPPGTRPGSPTP